MKVICLGLLLVWLFTLVLWLFSSQRNALIEARDQAAVRLLSEFHCDFLSHRNVSQESYLKELRGFQESHDGLRILTTYVSDVEERQKELEHQHTDAPARR